MKTLTDFINESNRINRKEAINMAKSALETINKDELDLEDRYEMTYGILTTISMCQDRKVADIASKAMDNDRDDMDDRMQEFVDALETIANL